MTDIVPAEEIERIDSPRPALQPAHSVTADMQRSVGNGD